MIGFSLDNLSLLDIITFSILFSILLLILIIGIIFYSRKYIKEKRQIITIRKLSIIALFFSIFIMQSYFTMLMGVPPVIPFSLDSLTIIVVAFIFGPIEGIIYGFTADLSRVFINGWSIQLLPLLFYPLTALLSGAFGRTYFYSKKDFTKKQSILITQILIFTLLAFSIGAGYTSKIISDETIDDKFYIGVIIAGTITLVFLEALLIWFYNNKIENPNIRLFTFVFIINVLTRIIFGWFLRSYSQYIYWGYLFETQILLRIITSSYLIPAMTLVSFSVIKASIFAMTQTKNPNNW